MNGDVEQFPVTQKDHSKLLAEVLETRTWKPYELLQNKPSGRRRSNNPRKNIQRKPKPTKKQDTHTQKKQGIESKVFFVSMANQLHENH
jgi:hypothetical protein